MHNMITILLLILLTDCVSAAPGQEIGRSLSSSRLVLLAVVKVVEELVNDRGSAHSGTHQHLNAGPALGRTNSTHHR